MRRADLEQLIRAAATIADDDELIVVGSEAELAQFPDAPEEMLRSDEADIYPKNKPERWELIDGAIGELSTKRKLLRSGVPRTSTDRISRAFGRRAGR